MTVNFVLKNKKAEKTLIFIVVQNAIKYINSNGLQRYQNTKKSTRITINPKFWNQRENKVVETYYKSAEINKYLNDIKSFLLEVNEKYVSNNIKMNRLDIKSKLNYFLYATK